MKTEAIFLDGAQCTDLEFVSSKNTSCMPHRNARIIELDNSRISAEGEIRISCFFMGMNADLNNTHPYRKWRKGKDSDQQRHSKPKGKVQVIDN